MTSQVNEGYIFSDPQFKYNVSEWENGKKNVLLITGLSGSGKTTLAKQMIKKFPDAHMVSIDIFDAIYLSRSGMKPYMNMLDPVGKKLVEKVLENYPVPKDGFKWMQFENNKVPLEKWKQFLDWSSTCTDLAIQEALKISNKRFIIEGVQIFQFADVKQISKCALIIRGESMTTSMKRRSDRITDKPKDLKEKWKIVQILPEYIKWTRKLKDFRHKVEDEVGVMNPQEEGTPTTEGYIFDDADLDYDFDAWVNGDKNVLLITGQSGSGKTTTAKKLAEEHKAYHVRIDDLDALTLGYTMNDKWFQKLDKPVQDLMRQTIKEIPLPPKDLTEDQFIAWERRMVDRMIQIALKSGKRFIIEGVQIATSSSPEVYSKCAIHICGTSLAKSLVRRNVRDKSRPGGEYKPMLKLLPSYIDWDKQIREFRKNVESLDSNSATEGLVFNKKMVKYDVEAFGKTKNVLLITGLSGSGKSTQAIQLAEMKKADLIGLDVFEYYYWDKVNGDPEPGKTDYEPWDKHLKEHNHPVCKVLRANDKYKFVSDDVDRGATRADYVKNCTIQLIKTCLADKSHNYVIEGLQIYCFVPYDIIKQCSIIVRGESVATSAYRKHKRGQKLGSIVKNLDIDIQEDRNLKDFRNTIQSWNNEKATESTTMSFDENWAAALELDLLAGGDPTMSRNERAATGTADPGGGGGAPQQQPQANTPPDNPSQDQAPDETDPTAQGGEDPNAMGGDDAAGMGDDAGMGGEDDMGDEDGMGDAGTGDLGGGDTATTEDPEELKRKINLRKLIVALHSALTGSIDMLQDTKTPEDDEIASSVDKLLARMRSAKEMCLELATKGIQFDPYEDCLRKYSSLQQFYKVAIATVDTLFPENTEDSKAQKSQNRNN